jgi:esterase/lipase
VKIQKASEARLNIGKRVWWDDVSNRYSFLRSGIIDEVSGRNINIDGDWRWMPHMTNLRTTEK